MKSGTIGSHGSKAQDLLISSDLRGSTVGASNAGILWKDTDQGRSFQVTSK